MADIELLKRLAEACNIERCADEGEYKRNLIEFYEAADHEDVAALIAENERLRQIISDSATACGAAMSPECTVEFMGHLPAEIAGVLRQLRADLERVRADVNFFHQQCRREKLTCMQLQAENERLRKHLAECADSLESEILDRFGSSKDHPAMRRKFECDMQDVIDARAAMGKGGGQNGSKTAETRASSGLEGGGHGENYGGAESGLQTAETPEIDGAEGGAE